MSVKYVLESIDGKSVYESLSFDSRELAERYLVDNDISDHIVNCKINFKNPGTYDEAISSIRELQDVIDTTTDYIIESSKSDTSNNYDDLIERLKKMKKLSSGFMFAFYPSFTYNKSFNNTEVQSTDTPSQEGGTTNDTK